MRGYSLIELVLALTLMATGTSLVVPNVRKLGDRMGVVAARESVAGLILDARAAAMAGGEGAVLISSGPWRARSTTGTATIRSLEIERGLGVTVALSGGRADTAVRFGPLGLGRFASETVEFRRGEARARLVVSSYGRVRRD